MTNLSLIGAHTSTQGGLHHALLHGQAIGATTIQLFTSNQRQWKGRTLHSAALDQWYHTLATTSLKQMMSHASYLINLGSNDEALLIKSRAAFQEEIQRCFDLKITYLNFHPGAATGALAIDCLDRIVQSLKTFEPLFQGDTTLRLLLESTAGQGSTVGYSFEQLAYIIEQVQHCIPIGVCIDTCHIFAAGYDIRTLVGWEATLAHFHTIVGLNHLHAIHVNDSLFPLGTRKDRHASLGEGSIGMDSFKVMMQHPQLQYVPKYLETPNDALWAREIMLLRSFQEEKRGG